MIAVATLLVGVTVSLSVQAPARKSSHPPLRLPDPRRYDLVRVLEPGEMVDHWPLALGIRVSNLSSVEKVRLYAEYRYQEWSSDWDLVPKAIVLDDGGVAEIECDEVNGDIDVFLGACSETKFCSLPPEGGRGHATVHVGDGALLSIGQSGIGHHIWIKGARLTTVDGDSYGQDFLLGGSSRALAVKLGKATAPPLQNPPVPFGCPLDFVLLPGQSGDLWDMTDPLTTRLSNGALFRNQSIDSFASLRACYVPSVQQDPETPPQLTATQFELSDNFVGEVSTYGSNLAGDPVPSLVHGKGMTVAMDCRLSAPGELPPIQRLRTGNIYTLGTGWGSGLWELPDGTRFGHWSSWPSLPGTLNHAEVIIQVPE